MNYGIIFNSFLQPYILWTQDVYLLLYCEITPNRVHQTLFVLKIIVTNRDNNRDVLNNILCNMNYIICM